MHVPVDSGVRSKNATGNFKGKEKCYILYLLLEGGASGTIMLCPAWLYPQPSSSTYAVNYTEIQLLL